MRTDPIVIANNYVLPGDDIGTKRPNDNVMVVAVVGNQRVFSFQPLQNRTYQIL